MYWLYDFRKNAAGAALHYYGNCDKKMQWKEKKNTMYLLFYGLEESWIIKNQSFADAA